MVDLEHIQSAMDLQSRKQDPLVLLAEPYKFKLQEDPSDNVGLRYVYMYVSISVGHVGA